MSTTIPNLDLIRNEALLSLTKEFDLEKSQGRYASVNPELIKLCSEQGLSDDKKDASRALFVSDYIFTESPTGHSEEDRRKDVIKMFLIGLERNESSEIIVQIFHLAYKTASMIRRSDIFMAGRGVPRETSLLILKDIFIDAYLQICSEVLGTGESGFELALLAGALKKTFPTVEYDFYKTAPKSTQYGSLLKFTWKLLEDYNSVMKVEVNDQVVIPNIDKTSSLMCVNQNNFSSWNISTLPADLSTNQKMLKELNSFISQADETRPLVYFRGKVLKTNEKFFLIRNPTSKNKPFLLLKSTADEVNVTEILILLDNRGRELSENKELFKPVPKTHTVKEQVKETITETITSTEVPAEPESEPQTAPKPPVEQSETKQEKPKKPGFFARLFGRGKKEPKEVKKQEPSKTKAKSKKLEPEVRTREITKEVEKTKTIPPSTDFMDFISHAMAIISVGDLHLFEIFDTFRESNYQFLGVLHSDFTANNSVFLAHKKFTDARGLVNTLDGLDVILEKTLKHFFGEEVQLMPEEILFTGTGDTRYVMMFEGNNDHLVGMAGTTSIDEDYTGKEPETFQRRTLGMRTNQILTSLKSNRFSDAAQRVLGNELLNNTNEIPIETAVLNIHK